MTRTDTRRRIGRSIGVVPVEALERVGLPVGAALGGPDRRTHDETPQVYTAGGTMSEPRGL